MCYSKFMIAIVAVLGFGFGFPAPSLIHGLDRVLFVAEVHAQQADAWLLFGPRDRISHNSSVKPTMDPPPRVPTGPLGLLSDGSMASCTLGLGRMQIGSNGQVQFAEIFVEQSELEFGKNGCDRVVSYPKP